LRPDECHICEGELKTCETVILAAKRIRHKVRNTEDDSDEEDGLDDSTGRRNSRARTAGEGEEGEQPPAKKTTWGAKSAWVGRDDTEVGVEQWVLEHWEDKGWKGSVPGLQSLAQH
jgi:Fanconi-associated nuclease 1